MQSLRGESPRVLAAVAASVTRSMATCAGDGAFDIDPEVKAEVQDRIDALKPCFVAQCEAARKGVHCRSSAPLVPPDMQVLSNAAKHVWSAPVGTKNYNRHGSGNCANSRVALQYPNGNGELHAATQMTPCLTPCKKKRAPYTVHLGWGTGLASRPFLPRRNERS